MKNAGKYLEPAYLYADGSSEDLKKLAEVVTKYRCRNAIVHLGDVVDLGKYLIISRIKPVIDFPCGRGGQLAKEPQMRLCFNLGCSGADVCVNLWNVLERKWDWILDGVHGTDRTEIKAIVQLPFLWQYSRKTIDPMLESLVDHEITVVKDWTTVMNFTQSVDVSLPARLAYLDYVRNIIDKKKMPLLVKIAGGVRADNAAELFKHGADILGVGVPHVESVYKVLKAL